MAEEQNYNPQPPTQPPYQQPPVDPGKGLSIAALVLGICGLVVPYGGFATSIVGLILGIQGKKKSEAVGIQSGIAKAGIVLSIIGIAISIVWIVLCVGVLSIAGANGAFNY